MTKRKRAASDVLDARWVALNELDAFELPVMTRDVIDKMLAQEGRN